MIVRLPDGQLRRPGLQDDRIAGPGVGHVRRGGDQDVDLPVRTDVVLIDMGLGLRPRAPSHLPLPERRAERHAQVGALAAGAGEAVAAGVIEDAEEVVDVGIVHEEFAVLVLEPKELGVERVGLLDQPLEGQGREPGHPSVPLGRVDIGARDPGRLHHGVEGSPLGVDPGVECFGKWVHTATLPLAP